MEFGTDNSDFYWFAAREDNKARDIAEGYSFCPSVASVIKCRIEVALRDDDDGTSWQSPTYVY